MSAGVRVACRGEGRTARRGGEEDEPETSLEALLAHACKRAIDPELDQVRLWRSAGPGRILLGSFMRDFPAEIAEALGILHVDLGDAADGGQGSPCGGTLCGPVRSIAARAAELPPFDALVVDGSCAPARELAELLAAAFPGAVVHLFLPPREEGDAAVPAWEAELARLAERLEPLAGRRLAPLYLRASLHLLEGQRALLRRLLATRDAQPARISLVETYALARLAARAPVREHVRLVGRILGELAGRRARLDPGIPVLLARGDCEPPALARIEALEHAGLCLLDDGPVPGLRPAVPPRGDGAPLTVLAETYALPAPERSPAGVDRVRSLLDRVRTRSVRGVVLAPPSGCEPAERELGSLRRALEAAGLPCLDIGALASVEAGGACEELSRFVVRVRAAPALG